mmetsp:Transcript_254/g.227  ORF Transcript_254/g.227 Transcript_254/m.227 type:complete len:107 (-) Transcript_254:41-361(-)
MVIDENNLHGTLPQELGFLSALTTVSLYNNQLYGTIPLSYVRLVDVEKFYAQGNSLTGLVDFMCENKIRDMRADCQGPSGSTQIQCQCCRLCCQDGGKKCHFNNSK